MGGQVPCKKCHADIAEEMQQLITIHSGETGYGRMKCEYCHRTFQMSEEADDINQTIYNRYFYTFAQVNKSYTEYQPGKEAHAATTIPCMYCHSEAEWGIKHGTPILSCDCHGTEDGGTTSEWRGFYYHGDRFFTCDLGTDPDPIPGESRGECIKCHGATAMYIPPAGGFNLTTNAGDTGSLAAHKVFVERAIASDLMEDANEACIACHTGIAVKINFSHKRSLEFDVGLRDTITTAYGPHNWTIMNWQTNGTAYAYIWGNTSGNSTTFYGSIDWPGNIDNIYNP